MTSLSHPQLSSDFRSVTSSQTTTENDDTGDETKFGPMDALLLQALTLQASRSLVDEEEALGKVSVRGMGVHLSYGCYCIHVHVLYM